MSKASLIIDRVVYLLHEHLNLLEEARRGVALSRATRGGVVDEVLDSLGKLRSSRARLLEEIRAIGGLDSLSSGEVEDLIALLGYYVEVAYANELSVLLDARDIVDVSYDLLDIEGLRREAQSILSRLLSR
ncbi:MAG: hypothetical protein ACO2O2_04820 [Acidilobaceae archaeon]